MTARFVTSPDGTRIAFEALGDGPVVVLTGGLLCDRNSHLPLAEQLRDRFTAVIWDRRGRGDSTDSPPYAVEREIEDLAGVIDALGGPASVYGHSSGAGLALRAAGAGVPIDRLVLHEPPYGADDAESRAEAQLLAEAVRDAVTVQRPDDAIRHFMGAMGLPPDAVEEAARDPALLRLATTMPYDHEVMGDFTDGGAVPRHLAARVRVPTLLLVGSASPPFFRDAAESLAAAMPEARVHLIEDVDHGAGPEVIAPVVAGFLGAGSRAGAR